jgi:YidC/Oxa1 family membrane protein insertase
MLTAFFVGLAKLLGLGLAWFYNVIPNYGVAVILLTVAVRIIMIPLAIKQMHLMEANRGTQEKIKKLQPEIKKLKEKYKDDRNKLYEEQKKLYDEHQINMLGGLAGCLPLLLQMPIFTAMYMLLNGCNKFLGAGRVCKVGFNMPPNSALHAAIIHGKATFLGMNLNLHPREVLATRGLVGALPYYILIGLMGFTMWYQTKQMQKSQPVDPQFAQTQRIMQFMPLLLVVASLNFPAGLTVYWSATNVWTIGQQYVLLKHLEKLRANGTSPVAGQSTKVLGFLKRKAGGSEEPPPAKGDGKRPAAGAPKAPAAKPGSGSGARPPVKRPAQPSGSGVKRPAQPSGSGAKRPTPPSKVASPGQGPGSRPQGRAKPAQRPAGSGGNRPKQPRPAPKPAEGASSGSANGVFETGKVGGASGSDGSAKPAEPKPAEPKPQGAASSGNGQPGARPKGSGSKRGNKGGRR